MAIIDDFKARFPNFDTAQVDAILPALIATYHCYYGGDYDANDCEQEIILQLLAHLFVLDTSTSNSPVRLQSSKSVGPTSVGYEASNPAGQTKSFFGTTRYGQTYLMLINPNQGGFFV